MNIETMNRIVDAFQSRVRAQGYTKRKLIAMQAEYFCGAMAALNESPPSWVIAIMLGAPINKIELDTDEEQA